MEWRRTFQFLSASHLFMTRRFRVPAFFYGIPRETWVPVSSTTIDQIHHGSPISEVLMVWGGEGRLYTWFEEIFDDWKWRGAIEYFRNDFSRENWNNNNKQRECRWIVYGNLLRDYVLINFNEFWRFIVNILKIERMLYEGYWFHNKIYKWKMCISRIVVECKRKSGYVERSFGRFIFGKIRDTIVHQLSYKMPMMHM